VKEFPQFPVTQNYEDFKKAIIEASDKLEA
jgi:hypothetical protein